MKRLLLFGFFMAFGLALAQSDDVVFSPQSIVINPIADFEVEVFVNKDPSGEASPSYAIGESIQIGVKPSEDAYIYLFNVRSTGEIIQILPNRYDSNGSDVFVSAGQTRYFPPNDARYTFDIDGPQGQDKVIALASKEALDTSDLADFKQDTQFATSDAGESNFAQTLSIIIKPKPQTSWVTDTTLFYVGSQPQTSKYGNLQINSSPSGAKAFVDGQFVGYTPVRYGTTTGSHSIRLELANYNPYTQTVNLSGGQTLRIDGTMTALAPQTQYGTVSFTSNQAAQVYINGQSYGTTPTAQTQLASGNYQARFVANGFQDKYVSFTVGANSNQTVSATFAIQTAPNQTYIYQQLGLVLYPGASLEKLEQRPSEVDASFYSDASLNQVYDHLHSQLINSGWQRTSYELKDQSQKLEANYQRGGESLKLELDKKGKSGRFSLELNYTS